MHDRDAMDIVRNALSPNQDCLIGVLLGLGE